ncbi:hypothetical protein OF83DRAFT_1120455 [Amylostereum chailletii]|nr:hypothetical protein OF83DRAFT_1120455 [Amylostereum chailletii]
MSLPSPPSQPETPAELAPTTDGLLHLCPKFRILVIGNSGVGKSALINRVFGIKITDVSHAKRGEHNIDTPFEWPGNNRFILHDSRGFETGEEKNLQTVLNFIDKRSKMSALGDQLHAIWLCIKIPFASGRTFETADEQLLTEYKGKVPIFVVFTQLDVLYSRLEEKLDEDMFSEIVDAAAQKRVQELCVAPLRALTPQQQYPCEAVSVMPLLEKKKTIEGFVSKVLGQLTKDVWLTWAVVQRANADENIKASIMVGKEEYWPGALSTLFDRSAMNKYLEVLCKDILCAWNMNDPNEYLRAPGFFSSVYTIVEDLHDTRPGKDYYKQSKLILHDMIANPTTVIYNVLALAVVGISETLAKWKKDSNERFLRVLMGFIVDLMLTVDTLFWLTRHDPSEPLNIELLETALGTYNSQKHDIHDSIRAWVHKQASFEHRLSDNMIKEIERLIAQHRFTPDMNTREVGQDTDEK